MQIIKLKKLVKFIPGINPSRIDKKLKSETVFYDKDSFDLDASFASNKSSNYKINENSLREGDLIMYGLSNEIAVVGKSNEGMVPSLNFLKVEIISDKLDRDYFLYMFNDDRYIRRQRERELQGLHILKLPLSSLYDIDIPIVDLEFQKQIGRIYKETIKLKSLTIRYNDLLKSASMQILSMKVREEYDKDRNLK